jgi:hypothetical protein
MSHDYYHRGHRGRKQKLANALSRWERVGVRD